MKPQQERLQALARFVPLFLEPCFQFGIWKHPPPDESGCFTFPWYAHSNAATEFVKVCYECEWVRGVDWVGWRGTENGKRLMESPEQVSKASAGELKKMLASFIRGDRFCDGLLGSAFDRGFLTAIVQRAAALLLEIE